LGGSVVRVIEGTIDANGFPVSAVNETTEELEEGVVDIVSNGAEEVVDIFSDGAEEVVDINSDGAEEVVDIVSDGAEEVVDVVSDGAERVSPFSRSDGATEEDRDDDVDDDGVATEEDRDDDVDDDGVATVFSRVDSSDAVTTTVERSCRSCCRCGDGVGAAESSKWEVEEDKETEADGVECPFSKLSDGITTPGDVTTVNEDETLEMEEDKADEQEVTCETGNEGVVVIVPPIDDEDDDTTVDEFG